MICSFGKKARLYSLPTYFSKYPFCRPYPFASRTTHVERPGGRGRLQHGLGTKRLDDHGELFIGSLYALNRSRRNRDESQCVCRPGRIQQCGRAGPSVMSASWQPLITNSPATPGTGPAMNSESLVLLGMPERMLGNLGLFQHGHQSSDVSDVIANATRSICCR